MIRTVVKEETWKFEVNEAFSDSLLAVGEEKIGYVRSLMQRAGIHHIIQFDMSR